MTDRIRHWRNRPILLRRYRAHLGIYLNQTPPKPPPPMPISTERALGNLNTAWADLHRAMHRSVPAEQLRAVQHTHRQAVQAYVAAALREFGQ